MDNRTGKENIIAVTKYDTISVVRLSFNELTLDQRESLKKQLHNVLLEGTKNFVIDLSKVGFISSLVIALVVFFAKEVRKSGGDIKLCGLSSEGFSIFQLTQLDRVFELYETERDALESFKKV